MSVNNYVKIQGKVMSEPKVQFTYGIEKILEIEIEYKRMSGKTDTFIVDYSHSIETEYKVGDYIEVEGNIRSASIVVDGCEYKKLKVYIFGRTIKRLDAEPEVYENFVQLKEAELLKVSELRHSYNNEDVDICDLKLKVYRNLNKYSIIFCTCWNNNARLISKYQKGNKVTIEGRLQSYRSSSTNYLKMEVSVNSISIVEDENKEIKEE